MTVRNYDLERADHTLRQARAGDKIKLQQEQIEVADAQHRADEQQLVNEMRGNKAAVDLIRVLFDYEAELGPVSREPMVAIV